MSTAALIVAAGRGTRAGGARPKQWQEISGQTVLWHTLMAFVRHPLIEQIILVLHADDLEKAPVMPGLKCTIGGQTRSQSVKAGLSLLSEDVKNVLIHDVARPCLRAEMISDVIAALKDNAGAAPALPVTDALWQGQQNYVTGTQDRSGLYRAQTPQGFHVQAIQKAHSAFSGEAADDVEVARAAGISVAMVAGDEDNLKITLPADFARAQRILEGRNGH